MSSLESSLENFFDALGELERAVDQRLTAQAVGANTEGLAEELDALKADRASLAAELERMRSQNKMLEELTDDVNLGIDTAISEIRSVLD
jgi:chaperonin cofactor prefoldin